VDIAHSEAVESDLERLIERRASKGEVDPDTAEALWQISVRRYHERGEAEMRQRWVDFHRDMHRLHSNLADEHAQKAEVLCCEEDRGEGRR
jgi:hypothetical protein